MNLSRVVRHLMTGSLNMRRAFPRKTLKAIERAVSEGEIKHGGELRFAIEPSLPLSQLLAGCSSRARAVDVFSSLRIWDTMHNNGVLVYVLLADRSVEIVADRGIAAKIPQHEWDGVLRGIQAAYRAGEFERGSVEGLAAIARHLAQHFPPSEGGVNELPDRPVVL